MAMCKVCAHRWARHGTGGRCISCFRLAAPQGYTFEKERRMVAEAEARHQVVSMVVPPQLPSRSIVVEGVEYWVMWDGHARPTDEASA